MMMTKVKTRMATVMDDPSLGDSSLDMDRQKEGENEEYGRKYDSH